MPVSAECYERVALEDPDSRWELHQGRLKEKPAMAYGHNRGLIKLGHQLLDQLDPEEFEVCINTGRVRHTEKNYYIPDLAVVPVAYTQALRERPQLLEVYEQPLPLVVEVWSPSTGDYDQDSKIPTYQRRGDLEIWRLHPYDRSLIAWRRQRDGGYAESTYREGTIEPVALPGVTIDLTLLFA